jgi:hypothetical protein
LSVEIRTDLDQDGFVEFVVDDQVGGPFVMQMDGWAFRRTELGGRPQGFPSTPRVCDIDGDGILEFCDSKRVYRLTGGAYPPIDIDPNVTKVLCSDLDGNGRDEVVVVNRSRIPGTNGDWVQTTRILAYTGGNLSELFNYTSRTNYTSVYAAGDAIIHDGTSVLANGSILMLYHSWNESTAGIPFRITPDPGRLKDAHIMAGTGIIFQDGFRTVNATVVSPSRRAIHDSPGRTMLDLNSDSYPDFVSVPYYNRISPAKLDLTILLSNRSSGDVTYRLLTRTVGAWPTVSFNDVDQDGDLDIISANYCDDDFSVLLNTGGGFGPRKDFQLVWPTGSYMKTNPLEVMFADVDLDGKLDAVVDNYNGFTICVLNGDGYGNFGEPQVLETAGSLNSIQDFNADGWPDIVVDGFGVFLNDGHGRFRHLPYEGTFKVLFYGILALGALAFSMNGDTGRRFDGLTPALYLRSLLRRTSACVAFTLIVPLSMSIVLVLWHWDIWWSMAVFAFQVGGLAAIALVMYAWSRRMRPVDFAGTTAAAEPFSGAGYQAAVVQNAGRLHALALAIPVASLAVSAVFEARDIVLGPALIGMVVVVYLTCLSAAAIYASSWKHLMRRLGRARPPGRWIPFTKGDPADRMQRSAKFETVESGLGYEVLRNKTTRETTIVAEQGAEKYVAVVRPGKGAPGPTPPRRNPGPAPSRRVARRPRRRRAPARPRSN